ncbi:CAP domain-containing protein [Aquimarina sp. I32.4]|uniref:CAP domain-containing protein n=1 Tax=Aquimarina sp. I32.4 TaxID=2053903 RepID=UPI000CDF0EBD|nr:CAP domain-containing protein [Aquimarina sp. I32.4]
MNTSLIKRFCFFILISIAVSCSSDDDTAADNNIPNEISITDEILKLVNEYRQSKNLPTLQKNETAEQLAIDHTRHMISQGIIGHDNFEDKFNTLKEKENATGIAENVASGQNSAQSVVTSWINSPPHRKNMEGNYTHIGIAAIKDEKGKYYYTQIFYR